MQIIEEEKSQIDDSSSELRRSKMLIKERSEQARKAASPFSGRQRSIKQSFAGIIEQQVEEDMKSNPLEESKGGK